MKKSNPLLFWFLGTSYTEYLDFKLSTKIKPTAASTAPPRVMTAHSACSEADAATFTLVFLGGKMTLPLWNCFAFTYNLCSLSRSLSGSIGRVDCCVTKTFLTGSVCVCQNTNQPPSENYSGLSHANLPKSRNSKWNTSLPVTIYIVWCSQKASWTRQ